MSPNALQPEVGDSAASLPRWAWAGCVLFVVASALQSANKPVGGGDTWVAMACGRYSLSPYCVDQPGRTWQMKLLDKFGIHITQRDPFSDQSRGYQQGSAKDFGWINQNWLTHVIFYKMYPPDKARESGQQWRGNIIVCYKFIQAILTALFAYWAARVLGAHPGIAAAAAAFGSLLSRSFIDLRPNVSSILFAIIMILLLAYWRKGRCWALAFMVPLMIIWSNVHGGFIYAIMILTLMVGSHVLQYFCRSAWPDRFVAITMRGFAFLLGALVLVILIPGIVSPFGWENLIHPLAVATGDEGDQWRTVIEWLPIWDGRGFGNETPYLIFLALFAAVFAAWWLLFFRKPEMEARGRRRRKGGSDLPWPRIDLAHLAIIAITILMSVKSRRFIFLGGVVLSPFLAMMIQEVIDMAVILRAHRRGQPMRLGSLPGKWAWTGAGAALVGTLIMSLVFVWYVRLDYFHAALSADSRFTVFERMVGIGDQPRRAMQLFGDPQLSFRGQVYNEWTHGGYVSFWQVPDSETGEPPCKVYIDGRAQAAYTLEHYKYRQLLTASAIPVRGYTPDPQEFARRLALENLNVALLEIGGANPARAGKGIYAYKLLLESRKWIEAYPSDLTQDRRYAILIRSDDPLNQDLIKMLKRIKINEVER